MRVETLRCLFWDINHSNTELADATFEELIELFKANPEKLFKSFEALARIVSAYGVGHLDMVDALKHIDEKVQRELALCKSLHDKYTVLEKASRKMADDLTGLLSQYRKAIP